MEYHEYEYRIEDNERQTKNKLHNLLMIETERKRKKNHIHVEKTRSEFVNRKINFVAMFFYVAAFINQ